MMNEQDPVRIAKKHITRLLLGRYTIHQVRWDPKRRVIVLEVLPSLKSEDAGRLRNEIRKMALEYPVSIHCSKPALIE